MDRKKKPLATTSTTNEATAETTATTIAPRSGPVLYKIDGVEVTLDNQRLHQHKSGLRYENVNLRALNEIDMRYADLCDINFREGEVTFPVNFTLLDLSRSNLSNIIFKRKVNIHKVGVSNLNLEGVHFDNGLFMFNCKADFIKFNEVFIKNAFIIGVNFYYVDFTNTIFLNGKISLCEFSMCKLSNTIFKNIVIENVDFSNANLYEAIFTDVTFRNVIIDGNTRLTDDLRRQIEEGNAQSYAINEAERIKNATELLDALNKLINDFKNDQQMRFYMYGAGVNHPNYLEKKTLLVVLYNDLIDEYLKGNKYTKTRDIDQRIEDARKLLNDTIVGLEREETARYRKDEETQVDEISGVDQDTQTSIPITAITVRTGVQNVCTTSEAATAIDRPANQDSSTRTERQLINSEAQTDVPQRFSITSCVANVLNSLNELFNQG